ncbi:AGAP005212-PA-like protein [Anopheles sinensis]|uniref:AGAP005212-PA-like protein n=1 Tax=Anopheles sinensis TaxID=74873 RepID=A0A084WCQ8_ANOSI|nr:AGAP005212-PA-like protein [Anopheles sinensis]
MFYPQLIDETCSRTMVCSCDKTDIVGLSKTNTTDESVPNKLFEYFALVDYDTEHDRPYVKSVFPPEAVPPKKFENLVIPLQDEGSPVDQDEPEKLQNFSLILSDHPTRTYSFCRRVLCKSNQLCLSLTYCLVTKHNVPFVFYKMLEQLECHHGFGRVPELLVEQLYDGKLPLPGKELSATVSVPPLLPITLSISRPEDTRQENTELCDVFRCLGKRGLIQVLQALLLEQVVVLYSQHMSRLTSCMHGLSLALYPFRWPHTLVTIVPEELQQMLEEEEPEVPMFVGTLKPISDCARASGHICYVQLDEGMVWPLGPEKQGPNLSSQFSKFLQQSLKKISKLNGTKAQEAAQIADALVCFYAMLFMKWTRASTSDPAIEDKLFEYFALVDYDTVDDRSYVKSVFPSEAVPHDKLENLVIPLQDGVSTVAQGEPENQNFWLILSDHLKPLFGFCRRVLSKSKKIYLSLTYCMVTKHNVPFVFYEILKQIEDQHRLGIVPMLLVEQLYNRKLPLAGEVLTVTVPPLIRIDLAICRPEDPRQENTELCDVFRLIGPSGLVQVLQALLLEQVVVLHSQHISRLTSCMHGLNLALYPFRWPHTLATIVQEDLQRMLDEQEPMFVGTLKPISDSIRTSGHICYVQLDEGTVWPLVPNKQGPNLSSQFSKSLQQSLKEILKFDGTKAQEAVQIADALKDAFLDEIMMTHVDEDTMLFLERFVETEMFSAFVRSWHASKAGGCGSGKSSDIDYSTFNAKIIELEDSLATDDPTQGKSLMKKMQELVVCNTVPTTEL